MPIVGGTLPEQILWDNEYIYLATKKAYIIMSKKDGQLVQQVNLVNQPNT